MILKQILDSKKTHENMKKFFGMTVKFEYGLYSDILYKQSSVMNFLRMIILLWLCRRMSLTYICMCVCIDTAICMCVHIHIYMICLQFSWNGAEKCVCGFVYKRKKQMWQNIRTGEWRWISYVGFKLFKIKSWRKQ